MTTSNDFVFVAGDTGPKMRFTLKDCDNNLITSGVSGVEFFLKEYCGGCTNEGHEALSVVDASQAIWEYCLQPGDVSGVGTYMGDLRIAYTDGKFETGFKPIRISARPSNRC